MPSQLQKQKSADSVKQRLEKWRKALHSLGFERKELGNMPDGSTASIYVGPALPEHLQQQLSSLAAHLPDVPRPDDTAAWEVCGEALCRCLVQVPLFNSLRPAGKQCGPCPCPCPPRPPPRRDSPCLPHPSQERSHRHIRFPELRSTQQGWTILDTMRHHIKPMVEAGACVEDAQLVLRCGPITGDHKISNLTSVDHQDMRTGAETFTGVSKLLQAPGCQRGQDGS